MHSDVNLGSAVQGQAPVFSAKGLISSADSWPEALRLRALKTESISSCRAPGAPGAPWAPWAPSAGAAPGGGHGKLGNLGIVMRSALVVTDIRMHWVYHRRAGLAPSQHLEAVKAAANAGARGAPRRCSSSRRRSDPWNGGDGNGHIIHLSLIIARRRLNDFTCFTRNLDFTDFTCKNWRVHRPKCTFYQHE